MAFSAQLRSTHQPDWDAAVGHRFVDELWSGTLDPAVLRHYLRQDALFCDAFLALLGAAVAHADDAGARLVHARQAGLLAGDEDDFFRTSLAALGIDDDERAATRPGEATTAFLDLMDATRRDGDYAEIVAVLLVAEWVYLDWADQDRTPPTDPIARGWIDLHRGPEFRAWVEFLRDELDRSAPTATRPKRLLRRFGEAVECELVFFDAAYDGDAAVEGVSA